MDDRRAINRLPVPRVLVKISTPERMRVAYLKDLSEGGVFIRTDKPLALERVVDVDLLAPGRIDPIRLRGRITRVQNDEASKVANLQGMGVKFIELTPQADSALKALVQEYSQTRPAVPAQSALPDSNTVALKQALETAEILRATLSAREQELKQEGDRRQELSARVLALTQELEGVKTRGGDGQSVAMDAVRVELQSARAEIGELKARLQQAEGNAESYRQEIAVLEADDANTRRLAETLAQQKQRLEQELKKAREEIVNQGQALDQERSSGTARSAETTRLLDAERARRIEAEGKLEQLATQNASLQARAKEIEPMLDQARKHVANLGQAVSDLTAARARVDTLEKALADEKVKSARLSTRERELRQLVAAISAKGDDVVVMDDGTQQTVESSTSSHAIGAAIGDALSGPALGDAPQGSTLIMAKMPAMPAVGISPDAFSDAYTPGQTLVMMTLPDDEPALPPGLSPVSTSKPMPPLPAVVPNPSPAAPPPAPPPPVANDPLHVDVALDVDMDADWGGQAIQVGPAPGQEQFLERLRVNERLIRRAPFFEYAAADADEQHVIGSLMGGDRFEDLKVLSRGRCTPEQLESHLLKFHQLGLIGFDA